MRYVSHLKNACGEKARIGCFTVVLTVACSCGGNSANTENNSGDEVVEVYHADNDIAMTLRSLVDAVRVGERLDSSVYDFDGILTDGQGTPLYTDVDSRPGQWSVSVIGSEEACVRNLYVGDLMAEDLRNYIIASLGLNDADLLTAYRNPDSEEELIYVYGIGDVRVSFSTSPAESNGFEGWLMSVTVARDSI